MITENTVLILGAGASKPYGYPTGLELRKEIINDTLQILKNIFEEPGNDFDNHPYIRRIKSLIEFFKKSSTSSIDLFLSRNKSFYLLGKEIITLLIANHELESKFREEIDSDQDWYFYLYDILTRGIIVPEEVSKFSENKISIITFNYDRSLEHFLYESLLHSFRTEDVEIQKMMINFKIVHVYGKLAPLPWEISDRSVDYASSYLNDNYVECAKNLNIIYDERNTQNDEIINLISNAKKIFFLGFGYAEENLSAIGLDRRILNIDQKIYGTAYHLTDLEIEKNRTLLQSKNGHVRREKFHLENCDSKTLLRNYLF